MRIDDFRIEIVPSHYTLMTTHRDRPGVVGKLGTLLGNNRVNIASMQLGRRGPGGDAMMALQVDNEIDGPTMEKIKALNIFETARFVMIENNIPGVK